MLDQGCPSDRLIDTAITGGEGVMDSPDGTWSWCSAGSAVCFKHPNSW